ncbi:MAG: class I tRNA ligase family protein, partial [Pseudomonadota bacterium]
TGDALELRRAIHRAIEGVGQGIESFRFNTAVAQIHELTNALKKAETNSCAGMNTARREGIAVLAQLTAPFAPHIAEECWGRIGRQGLVVQAAWPTADPSLLTLDTVTLPIQVNGKKRGEIDAPVDANADQIEELALAERKVAAFLSDKSVRKVIVVPGRIVNIVAS